MEVARKFGVRDVPTTYVINCHGAGFGPAAFDKAATSYGFFRQIALRDGRGWPCSSYAVLTAT